MNDMDILSDEENDLFDDNQFFQKYGDVEFKKSSDAPSHSIGFKSATYVSKKNSLKLNDELDNEQNDDLFENMSIDGSSS